MNRNCSESCKVLELRNYIKKIIRKICTCSDFHYKKLSVTDQSVCSEVSYKQGSRITQSIRSELHYKQLLLNG